MDLRFCTADAPMNAEDAGRFFWQHRGAKVLRPFFNLVLCECPNCGLAFTCLPPPCPRCGSRSYHPQDIAEGYCGACHDWTGMT